MPDVYLGEFSLDLDPPYVTNRFPANLASEVVVSTLVSFDVIDVGETGVDLSSVNVTFNGSAVITAGVFEPGFTGSFTPILGGYAVVIDPNTDFSYNQIITVVVNAADAAPFPNVMPPDSWTFFLVTELFTPYVENQGPTGNLQPLNAHVVFDIKDDGPLPVDPASIVIKIQGVTVYAANTPLAGYIVISTPIAGGYHFDITAPTDWERGAVVTVSVDADDTANVMSTVTWFFIGTTVGIEVCNPAPLLPVEIRLRTPLRSEALETLRRHVLTVISTDSMLDHRIRGVLLTAHYNDFRPVFADVLPVPADILLEVVCKRRKLFALYNDLLPAVPTMQRAVRELQLQGMSQGYVALITERILSHSPQQVVDAACATVLFGALFDLAAAP